MMIVIILIGLGIPALIAWGASSSANAEAAKWKTYAVCNCGYRTYAPFGDLFHVHAKVCPDCGESKKKMEVRTSRFVNGGWEDKA